MKKLLIFTSLLIGLSFLEVNHAMASQGLTYHGRILKPDETPVTSSNVSFRIQIKSPGSENCLLYDESATLDLSQTAGVFSLTIGHGTRAAATKDGGYSIDRIFSNRGTIDLSATSPSACNIGTGYSPAVTDGRNLIVSFNDNSGTGWQTLPTQALNFVPQALDSMHFAGYSANNMLRLNDTAAASNIAELTLTQFTNFLDLINGNSSLYVRAGSSGSLIPQYAGNPGSLSTGSMWYDSSSNTVKYYNGSAVQTFGTSGGSVNSVATGTGLSGGPITTSGTISIANTTVTAGSYGSATNVGTFTVNAQGQLTAAANTPIAISATQITGGALGVTSVTATGNVGSGTTSTRSLSIFNAGNTHSATITVPSALSADYSLQLPSDDGLANQVLSTDGSGVLTWTTPAAGLSTTLSSGQIYVGNGSNVATAVTMSGDATLSNAGTLTLATVPVSKGGTGATSFTANKIVATNGTGTALQDFTCTVGQVIKFDASGYATCGTDNAGGGTVTSVGLSLPSEITVTNSPVTSTGTLTGAWASQTANKIFASPNGSTGAPSFRTLVAADVPSLDASKITTGVLPIANGGTNSSTALSNNRIMVSSSGSIVESNALTNGQLLIGSTGAAPVAATITSGTGVSVTNGAGSISVGLSSGVATPGTYNSVTVDTYGRVTAGANTSTPAAGSTGQLQFNNGSNAFSADSNLTWDNTNKRLGIGVNSPNYMLDIGNSGTAGAMANFGYGIITQSNYIGINSSRAMFGYNGVTQNAVVQGIGAKGIEFNVNDNTFGSGNAMTILSSGNVGIGTTAPQAPLVVVGPTFSASFPFNSFLLDSTTSAKDVGGGILFQGYSNGTTAVTGFAGIKGGKENATATNQDGYLAFHTRSTLNAFTSERMRIDASGKVGIGTAAPTQPLEVNGHVLVNSSIGVGVPPNATNKIGVVTTGATSGLNIINNNATGTAYGAQITKSGAATTGIGLYVTSSGATNNYAAIFDQGNVGIGTTTPAYKLDVVGDVNVTGNFKINGTNISPGSGTVTSVGLSLPSEITVTNSPVTSTGTLTGSWASQTANKVFASPDGSAGAPVFRSLASADLPTVPVSKGGTASTSFTANKIVATNGTGTALVDFTCTVGQIIKFDASGYATCGTDNTGGGGGTPAGSNSQLQFNSSGSFGANANLVWDNTNSRLGVGTASPSVKLEVAGGQAIGAFNDAVASASIDFNDGNMQTTSAAAGTITITNLKAGGTYTLILTNATGGTYTLSAAGYSFRCQPDCPSQQVIVNASAHTVLSIIAASGTAYVAWMRGF